MDTCKIAPGIYQYTAIDDCSRYKVLGVYSRPNDRVILIVFRATTRQPPQITSEAVEVRAFARDEIPWDELAFWSTELALEDYLGTRARAQ